MELHRFQRHLVECLFCWPHISILRPSGNSLEAHAARMEQQCEKRVSRKNPGPRNIITCYSLKTSPNPSYSSPDGATVRASFQHSNPNENIPKSWPLWTINPLSIFRCSGLFLGTALIPFWILVEKVKPWWDLLKFNKKSLGFFYSTDIFLFVHLIIPWGPNLDPCVKSVILPGARKKHKKQFMFFPHHTFSIFIDLLVPWGPYLDPCSKSVILTGARKFHIQVVYVFLPIIHFPLSFLWLSLGVPTWILVAKVRSWQAHAKFT